MTTALTASGTPIQRLGGSERQRERGAAAEPPSIALRRAARGAVSGRRGGGKLAGQLLASFEPPLWYDLFL